MSLDSPDGPSPLKRTERFCKFVLRYRLRLILRSLWAPTSAQVCQPPRLAPGIQSWLNGKYWEGQNSDLVELARAAGYGGQYPSSSPFKGIVYFIVAAETENSNLRWDYLITVFKNEINPCFRVDWHDVQNIPRHVRWLSGIIHASN